MGEPWPRGVRWDPPLAAAKAPDEAAAALLFYAHLLGAHTLRAAAHRLVARLANDLVCDRVSLGLHEHHATRLLASSNLDEIQAQADLPQRVVGAMDEALDQGVTVAWPPATVVGHAAHAGANVLDAIGLEQQALQRQVGGAVASVPLGHDGIKFAALCIERHEGPAFTLTELQDLERLMRLAAPALHWMHRSEQRWHQRARHEITAALHSMRQPERRQARTAWIAGALTFAFVAVAPLEHAVGGRARVEGAEQRALSAPTDGYVKTAHVRPGDRVKAGDPLVDLLEQDLRLERERWDSQLAQHENAYAAAMARADRVGASTSMAKVVEAQSQLALVDEQLQRGRMTAPFNALVIDGDLSQAIGAPVNQGDKLLTLATTDRYRVVIDVGEADIADIRPGQAGRLVLSSLPWDGLDLVVERIAPLAKAAEGRNVFEVEAALAAPTAALRPGLLGRAEIVVGRSPPLWAWAGHAIDRMRLAWWAWIG